MYPQAPQCAIEHSGRGRQLGVSSRNAAAKNRTPNLSRIVPLLAESVGAAMAESPAVAPVFTLPHLTCAGSFWPLLRIAGLYLGQVQSAIGHACQLLRFQRDDPVAGMR